MLFQTEVNIDSPLTSDEIKNKIRQITRLPDNKTQQAYKFEGILNELNFTLYPIFDYGPRNLLRPEIFGQITSDDHFNTINLQFRLPSTVKVLFVFALIFNLGIAITLYALSISVWWVVLVFLFGGLVIAEFFFNLKVTESIRILEIALNVKDSSDT